MLVIHGFIFWVPLFFVLFLEEINFLPAQWIDGFIFLAILPTTISSCVVYTSMSGGDSDLALGHATLSNLLAVYLGAPCLVRSLGLLLQMLEFSTSNGYASGEIQFCLNFFMSRICFPCFVGWLGRKVFSREAGRVDSMHYLKKKSLLDAFSFLAYLCPVQKHSKLRGEVDFLQLPYFFISLTCWYISTFSLTFKLALVV